MRTEADRTRTCLALDLTAIGGAVVNAVTAGVGVTDVGSALVWVLVGALGAKRLRADWQAWRTSQ